MVTFQFDNSVLGIQLDSTDGSINAGDAMQLDGTDATQFCMQMLVQMLENKFYLKMVQVTQQTILIII